MLLKRVRDDGGRERQQRGGEQDQEVHPVQAPITLLDAIERALVVQPDDGHVGVRGHVGEVTLPLLQQPRQQATGRYVRHPEIQHEQRDDDGEDGVTERYGTAGVRPGADVGGWPAHGRWLPTGTHENRLLGREHREEGDHRGQGLQNEGLDTGQLVVPDTVGVALTGLAGEVREGCWPWPWAPAAGDGRETGARTNRRRLGRNPLRDKGRRTTIHNGHTAGPRR